MMVVYQARKYSPQFLSSIALPLSHLVVSVIAHASGSYRQLFPRKEDMIVGMYNKNTQSAKAKERSLIEQNEVEQDWIKARLVDDPHPFSREVAKRFGLKQDHTVNYSR